MTTKHSLTNFNAYPRQNGLRRRLITVCLLLAAGAASDGVSAQAQGASQTVTRVFTYTGGLQTFAVPADVTSVFARLWGAGGGGKGRGTYDTISGGGGAFVSGNLHVTPGSALTLLVGGGGSNAGTGGFGGGGGALLGASGGGRSAILAGAAELADAAAGGGGAWYVGGGPNTPGGAGGLDTGGVPTTGLSNGGGGTQTAGGKGGVGNVGSGGDGSAFTGGGAADGGSGNFSNSGGGGGGGGFYGGGGGGRIILHAFGGTGTFWGGGGGGASLTSNLTNFAGQAGSAASPGGAHEPFYLAGVGTGGNWNTGGGNGEIVLTYTTATSPPPVAVVTQPTEAALDAALAQVAQGGIVRFACDGTIPITHTKSIAVSASALALVSVTLDATGHNITLDGGGTAAMFTATGLTAGIKASWTFTHLTLAHSGGSAVSAVYGDVTASDCSFTANQSPAGGAAISASGAVTLSGCAFTGNQANGTGGAVSCSGVVTASGCTFTNNQVSGSGGAIYSGGQVTLSGCVFSGNAASLPGSGTTKGGAVYGGVGCSIANCAFLANRASAGGGALVYGGALMLANASFSTLTNCTFAGNSAITSGNSNAYGGALCCTSNSGYSCTVTNCTFTGNSAWATTYQVATGGGVQNLTGTLTLVNTLLAGNTAKGTGYIYGSYNNGSGDIVDGGHNICSDTSCAFTAASSLNNTDPLFGPLVYTGGATPTLSLLPGSPAIDAGDDTQAPATDQRGAARVGVSDIGAYERPLWQADSVAPSPNGSAWLLWNRKDGMCNLWNVDASGSVTQSLTYGPYAAWSVVTVSVGSDNNLHLLWRNQSGMADIWNLGVSGGSSAPALLSDTHFGPYAGWTGMTIATGTDNNTRLLWRNQDNSIDIWNLDTGWGTDAAALLSDTHLGPYAGWTIAGLSVGSDNHTRLLWNYQDGTANVWNLDTGAGLDAATLIATSHFGPFAGWTATNVSVGGDNNARVQWNNVDGTLSLWNLAVGYGLDNSALLSSANYGPLPGLGMNALSVGGDNNARLLWNRTDGLLNLWSVDSLGSLLSSFQFGPR